MKPREIRGIRVIASLAMLLSDMMLVFTYPGAPVLLLLHVLTDEASHP
jgi:hypothetical protein